MPMARLRPNKEIRSAVPECTETRETRQGGAHPQIARPYNTALRKKQVYKLFLFFSLYRAISRYVNYINTCTLVEIICLRKDPRYYHRWKQVKLYHILQ